MNAVSCVWNNLIRLTWSHGTIFILYSYETSEFHLPASGMIIRRPDHRYDGTGVSVPGFVFQIEDAMTQHDC